MFARALVQRFGRAGRRMRRESRADRRALMGWVFGLPMLFVLVAMALGYEELHLSADAAHFAPWLAHADHDAHVHGRSLAGSSLFKTEPEQCQGTPAVLALPFFLIVLYSFIGLAVITDDYFEPTLSLISEDLGLSSDVAGATFMAAGSSAPELLTSFVDAFLTRSSVGVGTILGSAMFNILVIVGGTALVGKQKGTGGPLKIAGWPLGRDSSFYLLSLATLAGVMFNDGQLCVLRDDREAVYFNGTDQVSLEQDDLLCYVGLVTPVEGLLLVLFYACYIVFMVYNKRLHLWYNDNVAFLCCSRFGRPQAVTKPAYALSALAEDMETHKERQRRVDGGAIDAAVERARDRRPSVASAEGDAELTPARLRGYTDLDVEEEEQEFPGSPFKDVPESIGGRLYFGLALPYYLLFWLTVPAYMAPGRTRNFFLFVMNIAWISALTVLMVYFATFAGCLLEIDPFIVSLVILAAGTSVPDALASFVVARDGHGDMAVSNALGSNVFDVLLGLGLPWLLSGIAFPDAVMTKDGPIGGSFVVTNGVFVGLLLLVMSVVLFVGSLVLFNWVLYKSMAVILISYYALFLLFIILANRCQIPVCIELDCARCGNDPSWF